MRRTSFMSSDVQTHRLPAEETVRFVLGEYPVHLVSSVEDCAHALNLAESGAIILGTQARLSREAPAHLLRTLSFGAIRNTRLDQLERALKREGWRVERVVCALPNIETARYVFELNDADSHCFLVRDLLLPRQHALPQSRRTLLRIYATVLGMFPRTRIFFRSYFILAVRV